MTTRVTWALIVGSLVPLSYLYVAFLYWLYQNPRFLPAGIVETAVLVGQLARVVMFFGTARFRRASVSTIWVVFALELPIASALLLAALATGELYLISVAGQIFEAWTPAFLIAFLPLAMYKVGSGMRKEVTTAISVTLPSVSFVIVALTILLSGSASAATSSVSGFMGISRLLAAGVFSFTTAVHAPIEVSAAATVVSLALVVYAISQGSQSPPLRSLLLLFAVIGVAAAVGWGVAISSFTGSSTLAFEVPALALLAIIWGITRAR